ncbi:hypothetical protein ElyMa_002856500 [Elysia marginata]|uniref:Uncharacterized protein n=1 Tax=Elysia marginata TaxID=1093978 RepID=A0AAV4HWT0_9GAST|nr:hypothetical protein ElyMa_002856500 [Elysia marginata]
MTNAEPGTATGPAADEEVTPLRNYDLFKLLLGNRRHLSLTQLRSVGLQLLTGEPSQTQVRLLVVVTHLTLDFMRYGSAQ